MDTPKPADTQYSLKPGHGLSKDEAKALRAVLKTRFKDTPPVPVVLLSEVLDESSPAHSLFEWDKDRICAQYFKDRAARLVDAVQVGPPKRRRRRKAKQ